MPWMANLVADYANNKSIVAMGPQSQYSLPRHVDGAGVHRRGGSWFPCRLAMKLEDVPGTKGPQVSFAKVHAHRSPNARVMKHGRTRRKTKIALLYRSGDLYRAGL